jgi:hypothetical protein
MTEIIDISEYKARRDVPEEVIDIVCRLAGQLAALSDAARDYLDLVDSEAEAIFGEAGFAELQASVSNEPVSQAKRRLRHVIDVVTHGEG